MAHEHDTRRAGNYLLSILSAGGKVTYARFYDGTDVTENKLLAGMGYPDPVEPDYLPDSPAAYMDHAVYQLERAGLVTTRQTGEKLADDEPAYDIELTEEGKKFIKSRKQFLYRDMDL